MIDPSLRLETLAVHAGVEPDPLTGAVMTPIYQTSTYAQSSPGQHKGYDYARSGNPTRDALQASVAGLEGGRTGLVFSSGLAAIDAVLNVLSSGDHVICGDDLYGGTFRLFRRVAERRGLAFTAMSLTDKEALRQAVRPETKLIWMETPTNPMLQVFDIGMVARVAREAGAVLAVDNTFMSPIFQRPLELGADIVMHSMTKYMNGHSDVVMGCLVLSEGLAGDADSWEGRLRFLQNAIGAVPSPFDCFLALRGIKTLAVRMERHAANAARLAEWLEVHPKIERTIYPGLASHPQHEIAARQQRGFGGMITVLMRGGLEESRRFLENVKLFTLAESLGGVESLIEHPAIMTHASVPEAQRSEIGILDNLVRLSVGIEHVDDLLGDLDRALARV